MLISHLYLRCMTLMNFPLFGLLTRVALSSPSSYQT
nr:MAG TPA: hypothetical protein [Caudoviricetes sp.]